MKLYKENEKWDLLQHILTFFQDKMINKMFKVIHSVVFSIVFEFWNSLN